MAKPETSQGQGFRLTPIWFRGPVADKVSTVIYGMIDVLKRAVREAARAGLIETAPDDAIPYHGRARMIDPVDGESAGSWRERLLDAWAFWGGSETVQNVSTKPGLQDALRLYMKLPTQLFVYDVLAGGDDWLSGAGPDEDSNLELSSRLVIVIEQPHLWEVPIFGPGLFFGSFIWGITMTESELHRVRKYFQMFRPAHMVGLELWVIMDATSADDLRQSRAASSDFVRIPLHGQFFGYPTTGTTFGPNWIFGQAWT